MTETTGETVPDIPVVTPQPGDGLSGGLVSPPPATASTERTHSPRPADPKPPLGEAERCIHLRRRGGRGREVLPVRNTTRLPVQVLVAIAGAARIIPLRLAAHRQRVKTAARR